MFAYSAGQLELEMSTQNQLLQTKDSDLMAAKDGVCCCNLLKAYYEGNELILTYLL
jgi:hypothetical protein